MKTRLSGKEQLAGFSAVLLVGLVPIIAAAEDFDFGRDIRPILSDACYDCHGPDEKARKAKLYLGNRAAAHRSGVLADGEMLKRLKTRDPDEQMPPPGTTRSLRPEDRARLISWLEAGAPWP